MFNKDYNVINQLEIESIGLVKTGTLVEHPEYGKGKIEEICQVKGDDNILKVNFESYGVKALVALYARLKIIDVIDREPTVLGKIKNLLKSV
ncbi:hypothetical protein ACM9HF_02360 [Colwellia sp. RE-S-Sl-9]